ncbi:DUF3891 family protein [Methylocapsa sp. D3K7]|uniref:DUF3891 family protein n=1 Tax=Methylocapsa sp. D3K7 TaxID=3041435 RepID=UPI00244ED829|nr:DUF3891 family protein [Methylocapsa sp. D3K7]WGJ13510.1 DUF3891 family protein [Methylocapsa sp. D3K7]
MLLRTDGLDVIAIPQPSHAWLSGQLARAWGNDRFAAPVPNEDVCLAAELHDIGWLAWEEAPVLEAGSGLPMPFSKVPPQTHIGLWREGVRRARTFGRYPALLVTLHADTIYARYFDVAKASPEDAEAVRAFLDDQHDVQARLAASLRADPEYGEQASPENITRNQRLIAALDWMSLAICWGVESDQKIPDVPTEGEGKTELSLRFRDRQNLILEPWPFHQTSIAVRAEGKRLRGRFSTQKELQQALNEAEPVRVTAVLHRA